MVINIAMIIVVLVVLVIVITIMSVAVFPSGCASLASPPSLCCAVDIAMAAASPADSSTGSASRGACQPATGDRGTSAAATTPGAPPGLLPLYPPPGEAADFTVASFIRTMDLHHASGAFITLQEAFAQAAEEITQYHRSHGFPVRLTNHTGADVPRRMSNQNHDYVDMGNWTGSVLMYSLLFDHDLIRIFDTTGVREAVYRNWGSDRQRSGKGQDNARTNLLEAILTVMGHDNARRTQLAWNLVWRYALRHPHMKRQQLLEMSKDDKSKDLYGDDDALADKILAEFDRDYDGYVSVNLAKLFPTVRQTGETPDYYTICDLTGCSSKNSTLKNLYWSAAERFRTLYSADSTVQIVQ